MLRLPNPQLRLPKLSLGRSATRPSLVGLDIEPGAVRAVQARVENGVLVVERSASAPLEPGIIRDGEVADPVALAGTLRALFDEHKLDRRVRIGVANQQIVVRNLMLPPIDAGRELDTAIRFMAGEELPMPVDQAVLDHVVLGRVDTPAGPRTRVLLVAARRSMIEPLLAAVRAAGLRPEGIDLSAFAMVRALRAPTDGVVVHLGVGGVVNLVATRAGECLFTRVIGGGIEAMAIELAERLAVSITEARTALREASLVPSDGEPAEGTEEVAAASPAAAQLAHDAETVLRDGVRRLAGEIRNSIDFHIRPETGSDAAGSEVDQVLLAGPAASIAGFADALSERLGLPVGVPGVGGVDAADRGLYAVAAGLSVAEAPA
ncbi:MAG: pilM [Solirubrobacteraceae bacterium]|nr:pilM [Solirubrobacteraceae bacterium]